MIAKGDNALLKFESNIVTDLVTPLKLLVSAFMVSVEQKKFSWNVFIEVG